MPNKVNLQGQTFGRWTVIAESAKRLNGAVAWECKCECGNIVAVSGSSLRAGISQSCGCLHREITSRLFATHGESKGKRTKEHRAWGHMLERCRHPNTKQYANYGGRGISVCPQWTNYETFLKDIGRAPGPGYSLERIDNNGNYEPSNCKWATKIEQANNTSQVRLYELNGETKSIKAWARALGMHVATLRYHLLTKGRTLTEIAGKTGYTA